MLCKAKAAAGKWGGVREHGTEALETGEASIFQVQRVVR